MHHTETVDPLDPLVIANVTVAEWLVQMGWRMARDNRNDNKRTIPICLDVERRKTLLRMFLRNNQLCPVHWAHKYIEAPEDFADVEYML